MGQECNLKEAENFLNDGHLSNSMKTAGILDNGGWLYLSMAPKT